MTTFKTFGARGYTCQIDRIDQGLKELGCTESNTPDFIYVNDSGYYDEATQYRNSYSPKSKLILNVLDLPLWNLPNINFDRIYTQLLRADIITCISEYVKNQLISNFDLDSTVIYNPTKNINNFSRKLNIKKYSKYKYLMVGRLRDKSKRAGLAVEAINNIEKGDFSKLAVVGSEDVGYGDYLGVIPDEELESLYNSVDYVFMTSNAEGLGLPALEGTLGGAIPIVCTDLTTYREFFPGWFGCYPNSSDISNKIYLLENNLEIKQKYLKEVEKISKIVYNKCSYLEVSNRIIQLI